ncbi:MAG: LysM peptidoglycan-binding domain-containing protein, partial [Candidatus Binatia bacterium]
PAGTRNEFASRYGHVDKSVPATATVVAKAERTEEAPTLEAAPDRKHKVGRGETLGQIARKYGTTETTLMWMNSLRSARALQAGQTIKVPADRPASAAAVVAAAPARPPFSRTMTTTAGVVAAKDAAAAAAVATRAASTAVAAVPAAVVRPEEPKVEVAVVPAAETALPVEAAKVEAEKTSEKAAAPGEPEAVLTTEHKVGRGQTLTQIASMYRTSVDDLKSMNDIKDARSVQAGQVLKVRTSGSQLVGGSTVGRTYKARSGDTLWTIAKNNDTSVDTIKRLNPKIAAKGLKIGDTLKVPASGAVSVASEAKATREVAKKPAAKVTAKAPSKPAAKATTKAAPKTAFRSHRVQKGQTLSSIALRYKTSVDTLKRINGIRDAKSVQAGKTLKVPL